MSPSASHHSDGDTELKLLEQLMRREFLLESPLSSPTSLLSFSYPRTGYSYSSLTASNTIRALRLQPGDITQPLRGSLVEVNLDNAKRMKHEALSYAWGAPARTRLIWLPDGTIQITGALHAALVRLRKPSRRRTIWIDALCINQTDNSEKATQILLMPCIYDLATCVLVYLGEDEGNGKAALDLLERIAATDFGGLQQNRITAEWMSERGLPQAGDRLWYALIAFWQRSWFRRAWVVQEFIKAKKASMICGEWEMDWRRLSSAIETMVEYNLIDWGVQSDPSIEDSKAAAFNGAMGMRIMMEIKMSTGFAPMISNTIKSFAERDESGMQELNEGGWGKVLPEMKDFVAKIRGKPDQIETVPQVVEQTMTNLFNMMGVEDTGLKLPLKHLLSVFERTEATMPRDKLFALLGLALDGDHPDLRPNYDETDYQVLVRYGRFFIKEGHGISMLYQAGNSGRQSDLPSWLPDYTTPCLQDTRMLSLSAETGLTYASALSLPARICLTEKEDEITVAGSHLTSVIRVLCLPWVGGIESFSSYAKDVLIFFDNVESIILSPTIPYPSSSLNSQTRFEVLWRTLVANQGSRPMAPPAEWAEQYS